jgi:uncharacterized protein YbaA (DUF1428 family)
MAYIDGFVCAVPAENKDIYRQHAAEAAPVFAEFGARGLVEAWGDDVPDGKLNDFRGAVKAEEGEVVVFSWTEYADRAARDAAGAKMMADPRMEQMSKSMPFDGKRMIYGGFEPVVDLGTGRGDYVDGYVLPVPTENKERYREMAERIGKIFQEFGAVRVVEAWSDDVPDGKITDYRRAAHAQEGESVVFSFVEWPSKEVRDEAWQKVMADERMNSNEADKNVFDGKRMIYGGFRPILDTRA